MSLGHYHNLNISRTILYHDGFEQFDNIRDSTEMLKSREDKENLSKHIYSYFFWAKRKV